MREAIYLCGTSATLGCEVVGETDLYTYKKINRLRDHPHANFMEEVYSWVACFKYDTSKTVHSLPCPLSQSFVAVSFSDHKKWSFKRRGGGGMTAIHAICGFSFVIKPNDGGDIQFSK